LGAVDSEARQQVNEEGATSCADGAGAGAIILD
jgi:hypothetical protein